MNSMVTEPVAIIGMACRFPGASSPAELWQLLRGGVDAVTEIPADRWNADRFYDEDASVPGKMNTRWGGFLERISYFDAHFFRVSPREAPHLDPQQRFLMEVTWEALEDAGQVPGKLAGTSTGVFIGIMGSDYADTPMNDPLLVNFYTVTGHSRGIAANRLSHFFDFRGPSMSIDTACSSSLVATNLACRSLWSGESTLAIAGGANVILSPEGTIWYAKAGLLARDGRCKTFDSRADGLVRSEGVGVVVLKLLSQALADGDPIHAIIKGGAINQDGRSNGLTAPNRWAQEALIREACAQADVSPGQVTYVEAHGTGTALGDPIEAQALGAVLATDRPEGDFCAIGSIKSNIGHCEAAAGVAGLMKVVLMLKHREIPPSLHYRQPNPHISFAQLPLRVQQSLTPWPERPALAGVNAFGFGGTNAHLVVSEAPNSEHASAQASQDRAELLPLSARSPEALRAMAQAYQQFLLAEGTDVSLRDICHTAAVRRTHHEHRLTFVGNSHEDLADRLGSFVAGTPHPAISTGRVTQIRRSRLAFVFAGQGPQWWAMGRRLLREEEDFRRAVEQCDELFTGIAGWSLLDELNAGEDKSRMAETQVAQPCLFALQIGLAALWRAWGIKPEAVVGHSIGEVAACYVAGALSLEDAVRVVFHRSRLMQRATGKGKMAAVALHPEEVAPFLAGYEDRVNVASHNSPRACVISGETAALDEVAGALRKQGIQVQELRVDYAFHSRQMWEFADQLHESLDGIEARPAEIPIFSTLSGAVCEGTEFGADYWRRQLRETVQFATAAEAMLAAGYNTFIELSPHPVLLGGLDECMGERRRDCAAIPSLRRKEDERGVMLKSAARLYTLGFPLKWEALQAKDGRCVSLPRYQWQRERFWIKEQETRNDRPSRGVDEAQNSSLVGRCMASAVEPETYHWEFDLDAVRLPLLADHRVQGRTVVPAAMYIEMALGGAAGLLNGASVDPFDVSFERALTLRDGETRRMQLVIKRASEHAFGFQLFSREQGDNLQSPWTLHGRGQLHQRAEDGDGLRVAPEEVRERCRESVTGEEFYRDMGRRGLVYGPSFQGVKQVWRRAGEAVAGISLDAAFMKDAAAAGVHPLLLDNCLQVIACAFPPRTGEAEGFTYLPVGVERVRVRPRHLAAGVAWSYASLKTSVEDLPEVLTANAMLLTASGDVVLELQGVRLQRVRGGPQHEATRVRQRVTREDIGQWLYEVDWRQSELPSTQPQAQPQGKWLIFTDESGVGEAIKSRLEIEDAASCVLVRAGRAFRRVAPDEFEIDPASAQDFDQLLAQASTSEGWRGVVHLWSLEAQGADCGSILHLLQSLDRAGITQSVRLWLVTSGAQPAVGRSEDIAQSPVWGLGRVIAREFNSLRCTMIDVNHATQDENASALFQELRSTSDEQQVVWRDATRYVARLQRRNSVPLETNHISLHADATYLITGGLGGLGLKLASWMVQRGAKHLVLVGRSSPSAAAREVISGLEATGTQVRVVAADVSDPEQVARTLDEIKTSMPPLKGVVHAAGVLEDALLRYYDQDRFARVLAPKVQGAWNLHNQTLDSPLEFFVLFSSISSVLGTTGQGAYAAGNSFLDALAHQRRALGLHGLSINWGPWAEVGMAAARAQDFARQGVGSIQPEAGLRVLERLLLEDATQVGVLPVHWKEFITTFSPSPERELFLSDFLDEEHAAEEQSSAGSTQPQQAPVAQLVEQLTSALPSERHAILSARLQAETCRVLGLPLSTQLDVAQGFFDLGMDSLMIAELSNNLQTVIERQFPLSMMFEHANIESLTHYLSEQVLGFKLNGEAPPPPAPHVDETLDAALEQLEQLSDEEALALLSEKLPLEQ
jgi:myxalamid-type polyketide synthase MxaD